MAQNETLQALFSRKSVRAYEEAPIPEEDVQAILQAAVQAPTAGNMTLWSCIRVTDPALKADLAEHCDHQPFIAKAPLVLVFYADYRRWMDAFRSADIGQEIRRAGEGDRMLASVDTVIACHAAVTAAESLGYGACYIGDVIENWEWHRERMKLPPLVLPVCMAVIGVPTEQQRERKKPNRFRVEDVVFENEYRNGGAEKMRAMLSERQGLSGEEFDRWLRAFTLRKWNCAFSEEMTRSAAVMLDEWNGEK